MILLDRERKIVDHYAALLSNFIVFFCLLVTVLLPDSFCRLHADS